MSSAKGGVYQRGEYWLDLAKGAGGKPVSERWYIWWYDTTTGHQRRKSTGTADVRLACDKLDEHYLATHRPTTVEQDTYEVSDAMTDYWLEEGQNRSSSDAIKARLKLFTLFVDHEADAGRLPSPFIPDAIDDAFLNRFRAWGLAQPIVARKKDEGGNWVDGKSRPRSASTVEESVIALKAALNHAFARRRTRYVPPLKHKTRDQVTPQRTYRLSLDAIAEILDFTMRGSGNYAGHAELLIPMRRYTIAAICTLARPDAILDMNVKRERGQWMQNERRFALNPEGRFQTKKVRPVVPVVDLLHSWLAITDEWFVCRYHRHFDDAQQVELIDQERVASVKKGWLSTRAALGIPDGWGPKLLRHSMATILANRGVNLVELEMALGHRVLGKTSSRYAIFEPDYLGSVRDGINDVVNDLQRKVGRALHPTFTQLPENVVALRA